MQEALQVIRSTEKYGQAIQLSPSSVDEFALVSGQKFGLSGQGMLSLGKCESNDNWVLKDEFNWPDVLLDLDWSSNHPNLICMGSGDGHVLLYNTVNHNLCSHARLEHSKEVSSVAWNASNDRILSSSWDGTIKIWDPEVMNSSSLSTFLGHSEMVHESSWSPDHHSTFASSSSDGSVLIWDSRHPPENKLTHGCDVLCLAWNVSHSDQIITGAIDGGLRFWDLRHPSQPMKAFFEHTYGIRRLKTRPDGLTISASYDFTARLWRERSGLVQTLANHTEFVYGLDVRSTRLIDCSWDQTVHVYEIQKRS